MELEEVQKYCEDNEWRKKLKISSKMLAKHIKRYYSSIKKSVIYKKAAFAAFFIFM